MVEKISAFTSSFKHGVPVSYATKESRERGNKLMSIFWRMVKKEILRETNAGHFSHYKRNKKKFNGTHPVLEGVRMNQSAILTCNLPHRKDSLE